MAGRTSRRAICWEQWLRAGKNSTPKGNDMSNLHTPPEEPRVAIDTSKMSAGQRAALELTEAAREATHGENFASGLFMGEFNLAGISPFPVQSADDRAAGAMFLEKLEALLREK